MTLIWIVGRCENYGQRPGQDEALREKIHVNEGKYSSSVIKNTNTTFPEYDGAGNERSDQSNAKYEQVSATCPINSFISLFI